MDDEIWNNEYLTYWERLPLNAAVLTSPQFGAWLGRRDDRITPHIIGRMKSKLEKEFDVENNPHARLIISKVAQETIEELKRFNKTQEAYRRLK